MQLQFSAKLGGQKTGDFIDQTFTGNVTSRNILFKFDFEPPTHCAFVLKKSGATLDPNCTTFPIALNESITSVGLSFIHLFMSGLNITNKLSFE